METFKLELGSRELSVEINDLTEQANGSAMVRYGDTLVLATCVMSKEEKEDRGFFPLTVEYEERYYAAGKIKGPRYIKRESRPSDEAILNARAIDRTIRPRFPKGFSREVQVVVTVLSWDGQNDPDILGILASSVALGISDIPWSGPVAPLRIIRKNNEFILNPTYEQRTESDIDILWTSVKRDGNLLINMIESGADQAPEEAVLGAFSFSKDYFAKIIDFQKEIIEKTGKNKIEIKTEEKYPDVEKEIAGFLGDKLEKSLYQKDKAKRVEFTEQTRKELLEFIENKYPGENKTKYALNFLDGEVDRIIHENIIKYGKRPDGRKLDEIRDIECQVGVLPRTHGSSIFYRGQTKSLSILTLGAPGDQQLLEGMEIVGKKRFMHHYNFPPYSVGEIKPMRGPGRREIGHGMLVEKALLPLIPSSEEFPYTIRVVSEILSSNGSSSMASVSSSSLALMDAGVPIKAPAAGIAVGLMQNSGGDYKVISDIQGPEDHHGDMDFKVAGTRKGITAIQMDTKIEGITEDILEEALAAAKKNRNKILDVIEKTLDKPREKLSPFAPRILTISINPEKIREVVGSGGKVINEIIKETGVTSIDIDQTGQIFVTAEKEEPAQKAIEWIKNITREVTVGEIFQGKVKRIMDFGAFVEILPGQEGLVHISQLANRRVNKVEDVVKLGDIIPVKVISIDEQDRINLSLKDAKDNY